MATESDKPNVGAIATLVAILTLTMVATVAILTALVRSEVEQEVTRKGGVARTTEYRDLVAAQRAELGEEAKWADRDAGVLSIPIEYSMKLVVEDLRRDPGSATLKTVDAGADSAAGGPSGSDAEAGAEPQAPDPSRPGPPEPEGSQSNRSQANRSQPGRSAQGRPVSSAADRGPNPPPSAAPSPASSTIAPSP